MKLTPLPPSWDPRSFGAKCDSCPLLGKSPVQPERNLKSLATVCIEYPSRTEELKQQLLSSDAGRIFNRVANANGIGRSQLYITSAIKCRPSLNLTPKEWETALNCCRPFLRHEFDHGAPTEVIALGQRAQQQLTGKAKLLDWFGSPMQGAVVGKKVADRVDFSDVKLLSTYHPAAVLPNHQPWLLPVFKGHISRAWRMVLGALPEWKWPQIEIGNDQAAKDALRQLITEKIPCGVDTETGGKDVFNSPLLNVGICSKSIGVSVTWQTADDELKELVRSFLLTTDITKIFHNSSFDLIVLGRCGLKVLGKIFDTILAWPVVAPKLKRGLSYICGVLFHAPRWKTEFRVTGDDAGANRFLKADPTERAIYNARDCYMTLLLYFYLCTQLDKIHYGWQLYNDLWDQNVIAIQMQKDGIPVDRKAMKAHRTRLSLARDAALVWLVGIADALEIPNFMTAKGPRPKAVAAVFEKLGAPVLKKSKKTKQPSYDVDVLGILRESPNDQIAMFATAMLEYRKTSKLIGTYLTERKDLNAKGGIAIYPDGRVHPRWDPSGAKTGRWACRDPNLQNVPEELRDIFVGSMTLLEDA